MSENFIKILESRFNLSQFREGQIDIIQSVLNGSDTMAVLPTGGGKSLCFQFPAIFKNQLVIVISPLIALMKDQVNQLNKRGIHSGCLYAGQEDHEKIKIFNEINNGTAFILYLSPERVQKEGFQNWILKKQIALFAVDEAHCVSQWGHDFREEYSALSLLKKLRPDIPILALTASATPTVLKDIGRQLELNNPKKFVRGFYRSNLYYQVELCEDDEAKKKWLIQAVSQFPHGRIIIYCGTRKVTEEISHLLAQHFENVGYYHAGMSNDERTQIQTSYETGALRILVATNAFGMGIDQPNVRLVVHYQMPGNIDSLYQEMGRAGRDGAHSSCLLLYSKKDKGLQSFFIQSSQADKKIKELRWKNLDALIAYSESFECRHAEILTYYKDVQRITSCGHCDVCDIKSSRKITTPVKNPVILKKKAGISKTIYDEQLTSTETLIFDQLKQWRKAKASELDVPAFVIFGDKTLREIAKRRPRNLDDLKSIYGIGESKLEKFGEALVQLLATN